MQGDKRWAATQVDSRYKKASKKTPVPKKRKESEESKEEFDWSEESSSEELDLEKVNQLLGADLHDLDEEAELGEQDAWSDVEDKDAPMFEGQSKRLALMNYDWTKIKVGDIMITFSSFLPDGGVLKSVKIYQSEFGKKMMEQEDRDGPGDIFKPNSTLEVANKPGQKINFSKQEEDKKSIRPHKSQRQAEELEWTAGIDEEQSAIDLAKLRKYERDRLKYYYAVLEFDSAKTADAVFEASNGFELEITGVKIDLRAVPDDLKFPYAPSEVCTSKPAKVSNMNFLTKALTHTNVTCTWDEPEMDNRRNEILFKDDMEDKIDLEDYIAPGFDSGASMSEEDSEEEEAAQKAALLKAAQGKKKLKTAVDQEVAEEPPKRSAGFEDFDKKGKNRGGLKIMFKNPLEAKNVKDAGEEVDNTKGRKVYSINMANKLSKRQERDIDEDGGDDTAAKDYFVGDDDSGEYDDGVDMEVETDKKKLGFKERMKEKRKQAKLDKEAKREQKKQLREQMFNKNTEDAAGLELVAGDQDSDQEFQSNLRDSRFNLEEDDMELDPTSTMYNKNKHDRILQAVRQKKIAHR